MSAPHEKTMALLDELASGDAGAADRLFPLVYDELREIARNRFRHEAPGLTLQPTALVNEAYLRMVDQTRAGYRSRTHFMALASQAMRRLLIDAARHRRAQKRGGAAQRVTLSDVGESAWEQEVDTVGLADAMSRLEAFDERKHRVVELRFFGGLSIDETATTLGVARSTVAEDWRMARAWLLSELSRDDGDAAHGGSREGE